MAHHEDCNYKVNIAPFLAVCVEYSGAKERHG